MEIKSTECGAPRARRKGNEGFSLIELAVAMLILAIVMAGAYELATQSAVIARTARNHYVAVTIAKNRLERAKRLTYDELSLFQENNIVVNDNGTPDTSGYFRRSTTVNTNYSANSTEVFVQVDIRNVRTGVFEGKNESVSSVFTEYVVVE